MRCLLLSFAFLPCFVFLKNLEEVVVHLAEKVGVSLAAGVGHSGGVEDVVLGVHQFVHERSGRWEYREPHEHVQSIFLHGASAIFKVALRRIFFQEPQRGRR